jgi:hypothetical protein
VINKTVNNGASHQDSAHAEDRFHFIYFLILITATTAGLSGGR